jgi:hypothetical protein
MKQFISLFIGYFVIMTFGWFVVSTDIYVKNRMLDRLAERRPVMNIGDYCKHHKYIPLSKFYTWPVDVIRDVRSVGNIE